MIKLKEKNKQLAKKVKIANNKLENIEKVQLSMQLKFKNSTEFSKMSSKMRSSDKGSPDKTDWFMKFMEER